MKIHLFAIRCGKSGEESLGPAEVLKLHEVSVKEFQTLVATGEVKHVAGLAAWARWMSREDEKIMEDHGLVSYNTDKYQEDHVSWWDCVDVISSSRYYPIDQWEQELDRIEKTVLKYRKSFFFAEARCMSRKGSGMIPNNRELQGELRLEEQCEWYRAMFEACKKRPWNL